MMKESKYNFFWFSKGFRETNSI